MYSSYRSYQFISSFQTHPSLPCFVIMWVKPFLKHLPLASWGAVLSCSADGTGETLFEEGTFLFLFQNDFHSHSESELQPVISGMPSVTLSFNGTHRQLGQPVGCTFRRVSLVSSPTQPSHFWRFPCLFQYVLSSWTYEVLFLIAHLKTLCTNFINCIIPWSSSHFGLPEFSSLFNLGRLYGLLLPVMPEKSVVSKLRQS